MTATFDAGLAAETAARPLLERFAALKETAERTDEGCLLWRATAASQTGYAELRIGRPAVARAYVHRLAWFEAFGSLPRGWGVFHHCDTPLCIEPSHLFAGTQAENLADMRAKGRGATAGLERRGEWDVCRRGHPLAGENLIRKKGGGRECRVCRRARDRRSRARRAARIHEIRSEVLYPRDDSHRYRIYARRGRGRSLELEVLACAGDPAGLGLALVTLDEDERERGRRLIDHGAIGVLDAVLRRWIVMPWHRPEEATRLRDLEVTL